MGAACSKSGDLDHNGHRSSGTRLGHVLRSPRKVATVSPATTGHAAGRREHMSGIGLEARNLFSNPNSNQNSMHACMSPVFPIQPNNGSSTVAQLPAQSHTNNQPTPVNATQQQCQQPHQHSATTPVPPAAPTPAPVAPAGVVGKGERVPSSIISRPHSAKPSAKVGFIVDIEDVLMESNDLETESVSGSEKTQNDEDSSLDTDDDAILEARLVPRLGREQVWGRGFCEWFWVLRDMMRGQKIVSFLESIESLVKVVPNIRVQADTALRRAQQIIGEGSVGVSDVDTTAMLVLYTMEWDGVTSFFVQMNHALYRADRTRESIQCWMPAVKLLDSALVGLPSRFHVGSTEKKVEVYRAAKWRFPSPVCPDVQTFFPDGSFRRLYGFTSFSLEGPIVVGMLGVGGKRPSTIFRVRISSGFNVSAFSAHPKEGEVIVRPLSMFRVMGSVAAAQRAQEPFDVVGLEQVAQNEVEQVENLMAVKAGEEQYRWVERCCGGISHAPPMLSGLGVNVEGSSYNDIVQSNERSTELLALLKNQEVLDLSGALRPLGSHVYHLSAYQKEALQEARQRAMALKIEDRFIGSIAIIYLYTRHWDDGYPAFHYLMNMAMHATNGTHEKLQVWLPALKLLDEAIKHLPLHYPEFAVVKSGESEAVYRALPSLESLKMESQFPVGSTRLHLGIASYTRDVSVLEEARRAERRDRSAVLRVWVGEGCDVSRLCRHPRGWEVLQRPLAVVRVIENSDLGDSCGHLVELEQMPIQSERQTLRLGNSMPASAAVVMAARASFSPQTGASVLSSPASAAVARAVTFSSPPSNGNTNNNSAPSPARASRASMYVVKWAAAIQDPGAGTPSADAELLHAVAANNSHTVMSVFIPKLHDVLGDQPWLVRMQSNRQQQWNIPILAIFGNQEAKEMELCKWFLDATSEEDEAIPHMRLQTMELGDEDEPDKCMVVQCRPHTTREDVFIREVACRMADIVLYVTQDYDSTDREELEKLHSYDEAKPIVVVHNRKSATTPGELFRYLTDAIAGRYEKSVVERWGTDMFWMKCTTGDMNESHFSFAASNAQAAQRHNQATAVVLEQCVTPHIAQGYVLKHRLVRAVNATLPRYFRPTPPNRTVNIALGAAQDTLQSLTLRGAEIIEEPNTKPRPRSLTIKALKKDAEKEEEKKEEEKKKENAKPEAPKGRQRSQTISGAILRTLERQRSLSFWTRQK